MKGKWDLRRRNNASKITLNCGSRYRCSKLQLRNTTTSLNCSARSSTTYLQQCETWEKIRRTSLGLKRWRRKWTSLPRSSRYRIGRIRWRSLYLDLSQRWRHITCKCKPTPILLVALTKYFAKRFPNNHFLKFKQQPTSSSNRLLLRLSQLKMHLKI